MLSVGRPLLVGRLWFRRPEMLASGHRAFGSCFGTAPAPVNFSFDALGHLAMHRDDQHHGATNSITIEAETVMSTRHSQRGISLIELIMFIVIVSVALRASCW